MAEERKPAIRERRGLYESAVRVKEISPWDWMTEADIFGVQSPETGDLGFVSVLGMLGEHYAMSLYLGPEGIHGFLDLQAIGPFADPNNLIQIPQLQASFENREQLDKNDRGQGASRSAPTAPLQRPYSAPTRVHASSVRCVGLWL